MATKRERDQGPGAHDRPDDAQANAGLHQSAGAKTQPDQAESSSGEEQAYAESQEDLEGLRPRSGRRRSGIRRNLDGQHEPDGLIGDVSAVTTATVVGAAAAILETELLPGILLGAGAMLVGKMFPRVTRGVRPLAKMIIRGGIAMTDKAREAMAETGEQLQDMVAEVHAERDEASRRRGSQGVPGADATAQHAH